eukprot:2753327-Amphidinium_carterae.1
MEDALQRELVASHYMGVAGDAPTLQPLLTVLIALSIAEHCPCCARVPEHHVVCQQFATSRRRWAGV